MSEAAKKRWSTLRTSVAFTGGLSRTREIENKLHEHCNFEYDEKEDCITAERLAHARESIIYHRTGCELSKDEMKNLVKEQRCVRNMLNTGSFDVADAEEGDDEELEAEKEEVSDPFEEALDQVGGLFPPPQDDHSEKNKLGNLKAELMGMKFRSRMDTSNDGVLGVQKEDRRSFHNSLIKQSSFMTLPKSHRRCSIKNSNYRGSIIDESFVKYNMRMQDTGDGSYIDEEEKDMDLECIDYVRKPDLANCIQQYDAMSNHPKYSLRQVVLSRRFFLYAHRFANAQYQRTLVFPTLPQPKELYHGFDIQICGECNTQTEKITEKQRTRPKGHRFIITADTQYGILMDGFAMNNPNWAQEIEISRKCVEQINAMEGEDRPLFVCVCGDLVDTESSFSGAIASWKKVMKGWERNLVFEQQVNDFKRVWSQLHPDIALVCLCGNHDVGNRPTKASIEHWTSSFGDDYLSFWANGTFNLCLNNCLFSNPTGAPDLFDELCNWMEEKLAYARENDASHIFVYGHFPWFLKHEEEADDALTSHSAAPSGWGPPGTKFEDGYFTIPLEYRKIAMDMFKKYNVTACFSGHFHQNVTAKSSWGMPMIVTGPLSMNLYSSISHELANGEVNGIGMRIVDVGERGEFKHEWTLLDNEEEIFEHAIQRCERQLESEERIAEAFIE